MGLRGPAAKPAAIRQNRIKRPELGVLAPVPPTRLVPRAPAGLTAAARRHWAAFWQSPVANAVDEQADSPVLERWIRAQDEYQRVAAVFRKARLVKGSMGQPVLNPLAAYLTQLATELHYCEQQLGLTPTARLRLGITYGEAQLTALELNRQLDVELGLDDTDGEPDRGDALVLREQTG